MKTSVTVTRNMLYICRLSVTLVFLIIHRLPSYHPTHAMKSYTLAI